ncbi:uncharacterized protein [Tursiops truncatus]|uniref:uncharacterized protein isoform X6 n=1 Tax=Tursiops truncatus TaxID=9739 RepID=UPI003CCF0E18
MKRRELSAAQSAVCPPAGGRDTWCDGSQPERCGSVSPFARKAWAPPWPRQRAPPPLGKGRGRRQWAGAGAGVAGTGAGSPGPHWLRPPPHQGSPHLPPTTVRPGSSCCSRAFTASASSRPLLRLGMATPTQVTTKGLLDTFSRWCRSCAGPVVGERQSPEKGCSDREQEGVLGTNRKKMQEHSWAWVPIPKKDPPLGQKPVLQRQQQEFLRNLTHFTTTMTLSRPWA